MNKIYEFRITWNNDPSVYRDIAILNNQTFEDLHKCIVESIKFDGKHQACFYRSNSLGEKGRAIALSSSTSTHNDNVAIKALIMNKTLIKNEIEQLGQVYIYEYDIKNEWIFEVEFRHLLNNNKNTTYPKITRINGDFPFQYSLKETIEQDLAVIRNKINDLKKEGEKGFDFLKDGDM